MRTISFSPPDIGQDELKEVSEALLSGWITTGPRTKKLEKEIAEYCGVNKAVCLNSATACLEMILCLLGVGEGDEVITSAYTYTASASPVCHVGAKLVLIDTAPDSYEMDYDKLDAAITDRTKVIIPVDLAGRMCDYKRIFEIADGKKEKFNPSSDIQKAIGRIAVVSDSAHSFGARMYLNGQWRMCGSVADFTSFSFHAVKNLTTAEGGALTWRKIPGIDDEWLYKQFMLLSLHGQSKDALEKTKLGMWEYDIVFPAYKCNMTDIVAAIGLKQMERYPQLLLRRKEIIEKYNHLLGSCDVEVISHYDDEYQSSGHLYLVRVDGIGYERRNEIIAEMAKRGVATNVHYKPLPLLTAYKNLGFDIADYPNAYTHFENEITLPLHTKLSDEDVDYVVQCFKEIIGEYTT